MSILDPFLTLGLLLLVFCLYLVAGIPLKDLAELSKPLIFAFVMFFLLNFPFAKPLPGEKVYFYLIPPRFVPITMTGILTGLSSALRFMMFIWIDVYKRQILKHVNSWISAELFGGPDK